MMPIVMPMFTNDWNANHIAMPDATSRPNRSSARVAMRSARTITTPSRKTITMVPTKPSSSPATVKMKSVCWEGTKWPATSWPWNRPWPNIPPEPTAILAWAAL